MGLNLTQPQPFISITSPSPNSHRPTHTHKLTDGQADRSHMVHSLPMAGGSHQRALTATPLSHGQIDGGREGDEGKRKREIMRRGQAEVEKGRGSKEIRGERCWKVWWGADSIQNSSNYVGNEKNGKGTEVYRSYKPCVMWGFKPCVRQ